MSRLPPLPLQDLSRLESREIWSALTMAHRHLAELKGLCESLPNQSILLDTLGIQEAKDSSEIENIISTHDELYASNEHVAVTPSAKEVRHYISALRVGYEAVRDSGLIRLETLLAVQAELEQNRAGLRKLPGTVLKNEATGQIIYEPPQDAAEVESLMGNLIDFINADDGLDPLLRMAIAHHQFESIHPFYDGNGRTEQSKPKCLFPHLAILTHPAGEFGTTAVSSGCLLTVQIGGAADFGDNCVKGLVVTPSSYHHQPRSTLTTCCHARNRRRAASAAGNPRSASITSPERRSEISISRLHPVSPIASYGYDPSTSV